MSWSCRQVAASWCAAESIRGGVEFTKPRTLAGGRPTWQRCRPRARYRWRCRGWQLSAATRVGASRMKYTLGAARCWRAVVSVRHRRGLPPWVKVAVALSGRVDARRLSYQCRLIAKRRAVVGRSHLRGDHVVVAGRGEAVRELEAAVRQRKSNYAFKPTADRALRSNQLPRRGGLMRR